MAAEAKVSRRHSFVLATPAHPLALGPGDGGMAPTLCYS